MGFLLSEVVSGLSLGFQSYKGGLLLPGYITAVTCAEHLTCSRAGYDRDNEKSVGTEAMPTDQSDQSWKMRSPLIKDPVELSADRRTASEE